MKNVLLIRATPNDLDINAYNVQQVGIGKSLVNKGYNYDFITFKRKTSRNEIVFYEKDGCCARCVELPRKRFLRWGINTEICNKAFLDKYDLIICQEYYQLETYLVSCKSDKVAMYTGPYYNLFLPKCLSPIYDILMTKKLNKQIKHKFVKSVLAYDFMQKKGYTGLMNVGVALDTSRFENVEIMPETQELINFMTENRCLLYVGSLIRRKNYPFLMEVYKKALNKRPDLKLVIVGKSKVSAVEKMFGKKDADYAEKYDKLLTETEKAGIYHLERLDNPQLKYIYPLAKAFLLPSVLEIFGMVLLEAMYFGAPVVCSRNGGSLTLIEDGICGLIVNEFDVDMWCDAILKYVDDADYAESVAFSASKKILVEYTWDVITEKILVTTGLENRKIDDFNC
jgi:glycosyltransferase involved in cell wall biosynthesis